MSYASRVKAAIALLVCIGLASSILMLRSARWEQRDASLGQDELARFEARLEAIRGDLPRYGVVGYVTDTPNNINLELVWTRYYLTPLVVIPYSQQHLVIGNFHKCPSSEMLSERRFALVKDYGNGLMLLMNQER